MTDQPKKWMSTSEVARAFEVCRATVYYWITVKKYFEPVNRKGSRYQVLRTQVDNYLANGMDPGRAAEKKPNAFERRRLARKLKRTPAKDIAGAMALADKVAG